MKILVTGGAGFIGSAVVRAALKHAHTVLNLDKLTYAANLANIPGADRNPNYELCKGDICDAPLLEKIFSEFQPDAVLHLAAESHVDRSIDGPGPFINTNIVGTYQLLSAALKFYETGNSASRENFRFIHVSTDEVYGDLALDDPAFCETSPYSPHSPYSASKAASDHLARAWHHTYGLPVIVTNCSNNYGPFQFPEKLVPLVILSALHGAPIPVYGRGENIRDWLYVEDHAEALLAVLGRGRVGETYLIGGNNERQNIELVRAICTLMDAQNPKGAPHERLIEFVTDRPGHDRRYAVSAEKIMTEIGWRPRAEFNEGFAKTVDWYLQNRQWWQPLIASGNFGRRLGTMAQAAS